MNVDRVRECDIEIGRKYRKTEIGRGRGIERDRGRERERRREI